MSTGAHHLPLPHDPENGVFDDDVENVDELEPNYEVEETNSKEGDYDAQHAAPLVTDSPEEDAPPVEDAAASEPTNPSDQNEENN